MCGAIPVQFGDQLTPVDFGLVEPAQQRIVVQQQLIDPRFERLGVGEVADPDGPAADFVLVGGTDAPACRADLAGR